VYGVPIALFTVRQIDGPVTRRSGVGGYPLRQRRRQTGELSSLFSGRGRITSMTHPYGKALLEPAQHLSPECIKSKVNRL